MSETTIQERIKTIKNGSHPLFIAELHTGYVVLGDHQRFKGYTLFLSKSECQELHQLKNDIKLDFLEEMSLVAECVWTAFKPKKLNYELLGNGDPHMHWHIFPRYKNDGVRGPVWWLPYEDMKVVLPAKQTTKLKQKLLDAVKKNKKINSHVIRFSQF